jgi:DNA-binding CsgD family transcriptional regulator
MTAGPAPDRFLVGLATLNLLRRAAQERPLLCVVDDAQWFDRVSAQVVAFVARRLGTERIALVCALGPGPGDEVLTGLPTLPVRGLGDTEARELLRRSLHVPLDEAVCDQLVAESRGNPLALLELPRAMGPRRLAGGFGFPDGRPLSGLLEEGYLRRLAPLPPDTRVVVLAAAAEPGGDPVLLQRAVGILGIDLDAVLPAVDEGLLRLADRVQFTHPLVRSAVYRAAGRDDRHRVHLALAEATDAHADPDRRAWHRARGSSGPDEGVAQELELAAARARARGGLAAAAAFLSRATELTADPAAAARRALAAADASVQAGAFDAAGSLLSRAGEASADDTHRARTRLVRARLSAATGRVDAAVLPLSAAARGLERTDPELALATHVEALVAALVATGTNGPVAAGELVAAARAAPRPSQLRPAAVDLLLDALAARLTDDDLTAVRSALAAVQQLKGDPPGLGGLGWLMAGTMLAGDVWDDESWDALTARYLRLARGAGALVELPHALDARATALLVCGDVPAAQELVDEGLSVQELTGAGTGPLAASASAAWRGDATARRAIRAMVAECAARGDARGVCFGHYAHALLCNGLGEHDEALLAACRARDWSRRGFGVGLVLPEVVEAAVLSGRLETAAEAAAEVGRRARSAGTAWALGLEARSQALLSEGPAADERFRAALAMLSRTRARSDLARTHLLYGEWLRGAQRRHEARGQLTVAHQLFTTMRMAGFAGRAGRELQALGVPVPRPRSGGTAALTPQEARIAELARDGLSNPEIGAQLFVSARTVEWHLRKVFAKVGVSSRRQLRQAMSDHGSART